MCSEGGPPAVLNLVTSLSIEDSQKHPFVVPQFHAQRNVATAALARGRFGRFVVPRFGKFWR